MDKKNKLKLAITVGLTIILILALANAQKTVSKIKARREKTLHSSVLTRTEGANIPYDVLYPSSEQNQPTEGLYRKLEEETKGFELTRDPFNQHEMIVKDISNSGSSLQGIIWSKDSPKAVINGKIVGLGDRVGDNVVIEILSDRVVLSDGTVNFQLRLGK
ncbi:MAG: general secretion pathway protein GspB [Candidatus Omnitrophica bacterium]|nr:general secretion pathway protein GspB [Candidatus Omnitrophota bacterium]MBU2043993.1 general secretion pathway protein GspB [Candidatus Omnitrophota bacterium]MBU2250983.1 general secretion pathway protein GspB [Candidatus Omnitrophota bacterium]MBU2265524.1 general secretion pathway protein GspB [Candidatus Omnitrophota bacterium]MBU2473959.1 general secretion pathway protein GspB [Candidatus Omnitrophota bacterium]